MVTLLGSPSLIISSCNWKYMSFMTVMHWYDMSVILFKYQIYLFIFIYYSNLKVFIALLLSWIRPLWLSPMATGGHPHRSTDSFTDFIPHNPPLLLITCPGVAHHLAYLTSVLSHTHCEVLFLPRLTFLSVTLPSDCYFCVWPQTALPWNSEPVLVTPTPAWYCLRLCPASDIHVYARWHCLFDSASV